MKYIFKILEHDEYCLENITAKTITFLEAAPIVLKLIFKNPPCYGETTFYSDLLIWNFSSRRIER